VSIEMSPILLHCEKPKMAHVSQSSVIDGTVIDGTVIDGTVPPSCGARVRFLLCLTKQKVLSKSMPD